MGDGHKTKPTCSALKFLTEAGDRPRMTARVPIMYRLLIITALLILLYILIRKVIREFAGGSTKLPGKPQNGHEMILDPVCRTYVPKDSAVAARVGGHTYFFCSSDCAQTFEKQLSEPG
jgi:YHS domain-containing protein